MRRGIAQHDYPVISVAGNNYSRIGEPDRCPPIRNHARVPLLKTSKVPVTSSPQTRFTWIPKLVLAWICVVPGRLAVLVFTTLIPIPPLLVDVVVPASCALEARFNSKPSLRLLCTVNVLPLKTPIEEASPTFTPTVLLALKTMLPDSIENRLLL